MITELDQRLAVERENERNSPYVRRRRYNQLSNSFFASVKYMTLYGYYTSEIGFTKELGKEIIPGAYHGCTPAGLARREQGLGDLHASKKNI